MEKIIKRDIIHLNETQTKMAENGWGEDVIENSIVEKICYSSDGLKVKGYLAYPKNTYGKKFPCVIWNRGGYKNRGAIDHFTARGIFGQIASWGYVVFTSQYRGNDGGEGKEEIGGKDVNDILNLMPLADELTFADKEKWGMLGWSRGGMMTFLALLKKRNFKCAVITGAISNMKEYVSENNYLRNFYKEEFGEENLEKEIEKRTVVNYIDQLPRIPYLIMHGGNDDTVNASQSIELASKFQELEYQFRLVIFEGGDHYLKSHRKEGELTFADSTGNTKVKIDIEIADKEYERQLGLMNRKEMDEYQGMLFIFPRQQFQSFWMRNTLISLDMLFVNEEYRVVTIHKNTEILSDRSYPSSKPARYVIEVIAGFTDKHNIVEGDKVNWLTTKL